MPSKRCTNLGPEAIAKSLRRALGEKTVEQIARQSGLLRRKRVILPLGLLVACLSTLGVASARWLADILRTFNRFTGEAVRYKPFHNQLAKTGFAEFLRLTLESVLSNLAMPVLRAMPQSKLSMFRDILLHDGSSFRLKDSLANEWPGRFRKGSPAAVEVHVTMSAFEDNPIQVSVAPDKEAERQFGPSGEEVRGCLLLEDRGYEDRRVFQAIHDQGGFFIVRGTKCIKPAIRAAFTSAGRRVRRLEGKRLNRKRLPFDLGDLDFDTDWNNGRGHYEGRLVVLQRRGRRNRRVFVYLHTNLARDAFSLADVAQLYRLRWQIELLFKEWKSHANLHRFDTSKTNIAEGLIWASMLVATLKRYICHAAEHALGIELSTQRAAASARHYLDAILASLMRRGRGLLRVLAEILAFMRENMQRAHPNRDRTRGRLAAGLRPAIALSTRL